MRLSQDKSPTLHTALLVLADGTVFEGTGFGATGQALGEVCFNTAMSGYQEILTDPSYAGQLVTFTFPHIGIVGVNEEDIENASAAASTAARGAIIRAPLTAPSNYRSKLDISAWMKRRGIVGISGIDTRALTALIRESGMPHGIIAHNPKGVFDRKALQSKAAAWQGLNGMDLVPQVTTPKAYFHDESDWRWGDGFGTGKGKGPHVVVIDYGVKKNILRRLASEGFRVSVVPGSTGFDEINAMKPDGVVLSNGPGDPAATGKYAVPVIQHLLSAKIPVFGICLGHQLLAIAAGAKTVKMPQGHHGANHPVKDLKTGKVEIVSMNHGFTVDETSLPDGVRATHRSLFDGSNSGIELKNAPAFSVQHHPEASPGPQDSFYIFRRFYEMVQR
jgi:carbamoyl-phosphate synthase small subunit